MTNLKNLLLVGGLAGSLALSGCGDNKKYQDFAEFVIKEGEKDKVGDFHLRFSKDNKEYSVYVNPSENESWFFVDDQKAEEYFQDEGLNGLDSYSCYFYGKEKISDYFWLSKKNKEKYDSLIINLPKWHVESKKAERKLSAEKKLSECSCPEMGGASKLELIGCYDIDKDGDLDCIYKQDSTQKIFLYENYRNGNAFRLAGEFHKKN